MNWVHCCLAAAVAALAPWAEAQKPSEFAGRPPYNIFAPRDSVSYVATRVVTLSGGPVRTQQTTITRAGRWQREDTRRDGGTSTEYSDFERGVSVTWVRRDDGDEYLSASQNTPESLAPLTGQRTGETQRWAGEVCEVWSWRQTLPSGLGTPSLTCLTHDGIELWSGYGYSGSATEKFHVTVLQRRNVDPKEVRLPASALDWSRWRAGTDGGDEKHGHEVVLSGEGAEGAGGVEIVIGQRGNWKKTETNYSGRARSVDIYHAQTSLHFSDGEQGRRLDLTRHLRPAQETIGGPPVPYTPTRHATILGRNCIWYDTMPGWHDVSGSDCRDPDGVVLARGATGWGGRLTLSVQATRFSASPPSEEALSPPSGILSWVRE